MEKKSVDQMLDSLRDRDRDRAPSADFPPAGEFKAEFFRRAAAQQTAPPSRFRYVWKIAALFLVVIVVSGLLAPMLGRKIRCTYDDPAVGKRLPAPEPVTRRVGKLEITRVADEKSKARKEFMRIDAETEVAAEKPTMPVPKSAPAPVAAARLAEPAPTELKLEKAPAAATANRTDFGAVLFHDGHVMGMNQNAWYDIPKNKDRVFNTEEYKNFTENPFVAAAASPLSTFGADVDTAGYTNLRRMIMSENRLPPRDAVRLEECLNYFNYRYPAPDKEELFKIHFEMGDAPWAADHKLLLVGVQARKVEKEKLPPSNFVFLIDNSGSMSDDLPLVIEAMTMLAGQLRSQDKVSIVTYGGTVSTLLEGASGSDEEKIKTVLRQLCSGGGTPGAAGIVEAYKLAHKHFVLGGNNRVVLITDGDFNLGVSSESELVEMVEKERGSAIYLSTFGAGTGNFKDNKLKMLANKGNGNYSYLDNVREARNAMVNEMTGKMFTLARDVKFQLEFNPAKVYSYRLLGYEFRKLADRDFNDDAKDSGEVGVGHQVTALYELVMADAPDAVKFANTPKPDELKYQRREGKTSDELLTFKLRYQLPEGKAPSVLREIALREMPKPGENLGWAGAVAEFGLLLRNSEYKGTADFAALSKRAKQYLGEDENGSRLEFLLLARRAAELSPAAGSAKPAR